MPRKIEISHRTIIFTVILGLSLWGLFQIRDILLMVFISLVLMSALNPLIDRLEKWRLPRVVAILIIYILLWGLVGLALAVIVPPLVEQTSKLIHRLPVALLQVDLLANNQQEITQQLLNRVSTLPENILRITVGVFSNIINVLTTLVVTFYLLLERKNLNKYLSWLMGGDSPARIAKIINSIESRLGGWVRGEIVLMLSVGIMTYVGLLILGVDIALPLAILAGVLEILPNIGPIVSAVPAILIALAVNPLTALATAAVYYLVQILENNLLVPHVMQRAVGVNPLVSILGLMAGLRIAGPVGAILAIPVLIVVQVVLTEVFAREKLV